MSYPKQVKLPATNSTELRQLADAGMEALEARGAKADVELAFDASSPCDGWFVAAWMAHDVAIRSWDAATVKEYSELSQAFYAQGLACMALLKTLPS